MIVIYLLFAHFGNQQANTKHKGCDNGEETAIAVCSVFIS